MVHLAGDITVRILRLIALLCSLSTAAAFAGPATAANIKIDKYENKGKQLKLGKFTFANGKTRKLTIGIGSGAFHHSNDPPNVIWTIADRGPNFKCDEANDVAKGKLEFCKNAPDNLRIYLTPDYAPSIYRVELDKKNQEFRITDVISLKDKDGNPLNGMPNPLKDAETPVDGNGKNLKQDLNGIDAEAVVRLSDGTFWVGEENSPSLAHFAADGKMIARYVPLGAEAEYDGAKYELIGLLPKLLTKRPLNRGIEGIAISPDEKFLYFIMQSPLANPNEKAYKAARNTRLFKLDLAAMKVIGEYVYQLDADLRNYTGAEKQNDLRISELMAIGNDRLIVLERTDFSTRLYEVALACATNILGRRFDDPGPPELEQAKLPEPNCQPQSVGPDGIMPLKKELRFDTINHLKKIDGKNEGMALLPDGGLLLITDDDFGIKGAHTQIVVVYGTGITRQ
jgi:hypothetical protein